MNVKVAVNECINIVMIKCYQTYVSTKFHQTSKQQKSTAFFQKVYKK